MAKVIYDCYVIKNNVNTESIGKVYGRVINTETVNLRQLARHIAEHGSLYTIDVVHGVLLKAQGCIIEMLLESKRVKLDGLGTFYLSGTSKGRTQGEGFNPKDDFKGLHIRFRPDMTVEENLSSPLMLRRATFVKVNDLINPTTLLTEGNSESGGETPTDPSQSGSNGSGTTPNPSQGGGSNDGDNGDGME